jgi:septal ring-binding cell division protein DamX
MSREAELYKDKIEVSLDGRQIFYLFFGGSVIVGLVFVLGVMVGRRVEARGHSDRARVAATVDPLAALDRLEGGNGLSFQGALRGADEPASDVEKTIAALPKADDAAAADKHVAAKKAEPAKPAEDKASDEHAAPAKADKQPDAAKVEPAKVEKKIEPAKAEKKPDPAKAEPVKAASAASADKKPDAKSEAKAAPAEKKAEKPKFTLQLSSFQDKAEAVAYLDAVKGAGYQPYMTEGAVDGKQYFRVRLGSYQTIEDANHARSELQKAANRSSIVIKL